MTPDALATLHRHAFTAQRPWSAQEFAALLDSPHVFLIATENGFALGRVIVDEAELLTLATAPTHQRQGLGRKMLAAFETGAQARGATRAFLEVAADNTPAIGLYTSAHYQRDGLRPGYYQTRDGRSVDAVLMSRALTQG
ncbi:GNAT family N-acetyltransferase [Thalassobius sp. S69A]|uniref:GNAT family N-acetyltransferase n=1 Tax=unclassified Thalassovita TaxID=2619711 RepID=UPI000C1135F0|nr:ribosomal-protein-alanine acetyltransferase [Paracoccaceae bacterium]MBT27056.1 ribosomal-protein-alanine acetyltransferase [Paracoccaceae bacterium]